MIGSLALHAGLLVAFASLPSRAHASSVPEPLVEIDFVEMQAERPPVLPEPEPMAALPLGHLEAPSTAAPSPLPSEEPSAPLEEQSAAAEMPSSPEVLAVDNPYASADAAVFTSGSSASKPAPVVRQVREAAPAFGVEGGSSRPSSDKTQELRGWYARVQSQLASLGTQNYPRRALKLGQQGTAKVTVTIDETGTLVAARLAAGSGVASLDEAAMQRLQAGLKVAPPPPGSGTNQLVVPVTFRIN